MPETIDILLVDDEPRSLDALQTVLDDPTYRLLRAGCADELLRVLVQGPVAAIVLDVKMSGVAGLELARLIKGSKRFREIPIVFLTACPLDDEDVLTGYGAGAVDYLTKPVNPRVLKHKVAVFADLFRKTRALAELNEQLESCVEQRTAELEKSQSALRAVGKQKDQFLATLAHELRNPLAPMRLGLDVLLRQPGQGPTVARTLAAMNRQLEHMVRLIDDLLDVSRISRGTLEIRKEQVDLFGVIERAVEAADPSFVRRQQSIAIVREEPMAAWVDATRVAQIVGNLLTNASKHSPSGGRVRVELGRERDRAVIRVVDEGEGIPSDQLGLVFEMFTKIERSGQRANDGLGIGLALSRQLAELHGGTLTASSAGEGKGATFTLSLPIGIHADGAGAPAQSTAQVPAPKSGLNIVVVEDNEDTADTMSDWLEYLGHEVQVARTGPDGVALVMQARPDVVLCDIGLPGMDGVDVCRRIVHEMAEPPVMVALTGWGTERDRRRTVEAGFRHHLVKPVAPEHLRDVLLGCRRVARS
ncbi:MAG TPA: response regulator [Polyangiaceae bacterium]|nr:response regulator [Polyangiaceae bacterium]